MHKLTSIALTLFLILTPVAFAQESDNGVNEFEQQQNENRSPRPEIVFQEMLDDDGKAALQAALSEYYRYHETGYQHRRDVFEWQLLSSRIIFVMVILLVLVGVYFSWVQFRATNAVVPGTTDKDATDTHATDKKGPIATTVEASLQGIKVTSPVLGVVILVISLAFFYLYLVYIYPVKELF